MLKLKGIDHINFNVSNLEESTKWYKDLFGFEEKESGFGSSGAPYKIIGLPGVLYLALYESSGSLENQSLNHFGLHIEDFESSIQKLRDKNIKIHYGGVIDYEKSQSAYIVDPNGVEIELSSNFGGGLN